MVSLQSSNWWIPFVFWTAGRTVTCEATILHCNVCGMKSAATLLKCIDTNTRSLPIKQVKIMYHLFPPEPWSSRQRSERSSVRHCSDLRLWRRGLSDGQPEFHRLQQLWRRPGLRLPQWLGTTLSETGQHVRPTIRWTVPWQKEGSQPVRDTDPTEGLCLDTLGKILKRWSTRWEKKNKTTTL